MIPNLSQTKKTKRSQSSLLLEENWLCRSANTRVWVRTDARFEPREHVPIDKSSASQQDSQKKDSDKSKPVS
jgi:hypothetical protein